MQFHIPQYIEIEDKLFGPLTLKQAIYIAGGGGAIYIVYRLFSSYLFIGAPLMVGLAVLTWALAFYPKEKLGRPFIEILEAGLSYTLKDKLYTWKKTTKEPQAGKEEAYISSQPLNTPTVPMGKLSSTSFDLGVKNPKKEDDDEETRKTHLMTKL